MAIVGNSKLLKVEDIDAALQFGRCFSSKKWVTFYKVYGIVSGLLLAVFLLLLLSGPPYDKDMIACIIGGSITSICLLGIDILIFMYCNSGKKKVRVWLQDAVILRARTKKTDGTIEARYPGIFAKGSAIEIRFSYMKKHYVRSSDQPGKISCLPVYNKYVDKDILIAYSPKYDQVMLIRPKSEERIRASMDI